MSKNPRYDGQPLLRLLECYVLSCIGELSDEDAARLEALSPKLRDTYGVSGNWKEILRQVMSFSPELDAAISDIWKRNLETAEQRGEEIDPEYFAVTVVDKNFRNEQK